MKLTITVVGLPIIRERWEAGAMAHETHVAHAEGSELVVDSPDSATILEQSEKFLARVMSGSDDPLELPQSKAWHDLHDKKCRELDDLRGACDGRDAVIAQRNETIDVMKTWKSRARSALEIIDELDKFIGGLARLQRDSGTGQAVRWPQGLRGRMKDLKRLYPQKP